MSPSAPCAVSIPVEPSSPMPSPSTIACWSGSDHHPAVCTHDSRSFTYGALIDRHLDSMVRDLVVDFRFQPRKGNHKAEITVHFQAFHELFNLLSWYDPLDVGSAPTPLVPPALTVVRLQLFRRRLIDRRPPVGLLNLENYRPQSVVTTTNCHSRLAYPITIIKELSVSSGPVCERKNILVYGLPRLITKTFRTSIVSKKKPVLL